MRTPLYDREPPKCPRCGSTEWEYCATDRDDNIICCDDCASWDSVSFYMETMDRKAEDIEADRQYDQWKEEQYGY